MTRIRSPLLSTFRTLKLSFRGPVALHTQIQHISCPNPSWSKTVNARLLPKLHCLIRDIAITSVRQHWDGTAYNVVTLARLTHRFLANCTLYIWIHWLSLLHVTVAWSVHCDYTQYRCWVSLLCIGWRILSMLPLLWVTCKEIWQMPGKQ